CPASRAGTRRCATSGCPARCACRCGTGWSRRLRPYGGEGSELPDLDQLLRERGERLEPVLAHDGEVLDSAAAEPGQVDPRLDRHDLTDGERVPRFRRETRRLVHVAADAVTEPVPEVLAEAGRLDHAARDAVGLDAGHAGLELGHR